MRHTSLIALLVASIFTLTATANTITVDLNGGGDYERIRQGIDAASEGDTVLVAPGVYNGYRNRLLEFGGAGVVLRSTDGPDATVIDAEVVTRAFFFRSGEDTTAVVEGFEIAHGYADSGAGVFCTNGSSPKFVNCTFTGNGVGGDTYRGGAVCCLESSPVFVDCRFVGNASEDHDLSCGGAVAAIGDAAPRLEGCSFSGNAASAFGGAVYATHAAPFLVGCTFSDNIAGTGGGGIFVGSEATLRVFGSTFERNSASSGGALFSQSATPFVLDCVFTDNAALDAGGAASLLYPSIPIMARCALTGNSAERGGGVFCGGGNSAALRSCTLVGNASTSGASAVHCSGASPLISDSILAFNSGHGPVVCEQLSPRQEPALTHCFVFGNAGGDSLCGDHSENRFDDPLFCDSTGGDLTLCSDSECLPANNDWSLAIGMYGEGCGDCATPIEPSTWGRIKAMYSEETRGGR